MMDDYVITIFVNITLIRLSNSNRKKTSAICSEVHIQVHWILDSHRKFWVSFSLLKLLRFNPIMTFSWQIVYQAFCCSIKIWSIFQVYLWTSWALNCDLLARLIYGVLDVLWLRWLQGSLYGASNTKRCTF